MRVKRRLMAAVAGLLAMFVATPAEAAVDARTTVQVQVAANVSISGYDIDYAIKYLNARTTRTRLVRGRCVSGPARCIDVRFAVLRSSAWYGYGAPPSPARSGYIHLAAASKQAGSATRRRLFLHEIGHARNLEHGSSCASVMYTWLSCAGKLVPYAFTAAETAALNRQ